jgi:hypothetical protein
MPNSKPPRAVLQRERQRFESDLSLAQEIGLITVGFIVALVGAIGLVQVTAPPLDESSGLAIGVFSAALGLGTVCVLTTLCERHNDRVRRAWAARRKAEQTDRRAR